MGTWYEVVNWTRRERLCLYHLAFKGRGELIESRVAAAIVNAYLMERRGDWIAYIGDTDGFWPFPDGSVEESGTYPDATDAIIDLLISYKILVEDERDHLETNDPDCYIRRLRHIGHGPDVQW